VDSKAKKPIKCHGF